MIEQTVIRALCAFLSILLFATTTIAQQEIDPEYVGRCTELYTYQKSLRQLLREKKYADLSARAHEIENEVQADITKEQRFNDFSSAFEIRDESIGSLLAEWRRNEPETALVHALLAGYHLNLGWRIRGHNTVDKTNPKSLEEFHKHLAVVEDAATQAATLNPKWLPTYRYLINAFASTNRDSESEKAFHAALAYYPYTAQLRVTYLRFLFPEWGGSYVGMREFVDEAEKVRGSNPEVRKVKQELLMRAARSLKKDEPAKAMALYEETLAEGPHGQAFAQKAMHMLYRQKDPIAALDLINKAVATDCFTSEIRTKRSRVLVELRKIDEALSELKLVRASNPDDYYYVNFRGQIAKHALYIADTMKSTEPDRCLSIVALVRDAYPDYIGNDAQEGTCLIFKNDLDGAATKLKSAIVLAPHDFNAHQNLAFVYSKQQKFKETVELYTSFIENHPMEGAAYRERGRANYKLGQKKAAKKDYQKACVLGDLEACKSAPPFPSQTTLLAGLLGAAVLLVILRVRKSNKGKDRLAS